MNNNIVIIFVIAFITFLTRALPFIVFSNKKSLIIEYLGKVLPYSIMAMLVVYCLKDVDFLSGYYGISEIIAVFSVVFLHINQRNTLLSIVIGTIIYMICIQYIFI